MEILFSVLFPSAVLLNKKKIFMSTSLKSITVYQINILSYICLSIDLSCPDRTHGADSHNACSPVASSWEKIERNQFILRFFFKVLFVKHIESYKYIKAHIQIKAKLLVYIKHLHNVS